MKLELLSRLLHKLLLMLLCFIPLQSTAQQSARWIPFQARLSDSSGNDPDRDSRVPRYAGGISGNLPGTYQEDQFKSHVHDYTYQFVGGSPPPVSSVEGGNGYPRVTRTGTTAPSGGPGETRPRNAYVDYIIKE